MILLVGLELKIYHLTLVDMPILRSESSISIITGQILSIGHTLLSFGLRISTTIIAIASMPIGNYLHQISQKRYSVAAFLAYLHLPWIKI
jgi:hypothetical protein